MTQVKKLCKSNFYFGHTIWVGNGVVFAAFCLIVSCLMFHFHDIEIIKTVFLLTETLLVENRFLRCATTLC